MIILPTKKGSVYIKKSKGKSFTPKKKFTNTVIDLTSQAPTYPKNIMAFGNEGSYIAKKQCRDDKLCAVCGKIIREKTPLYERQEYVVYRKAYYKGVEWWCLDHGIPKRIGREHFTKR